MVSVDFLNKLLQEAQNCYDRMAEAQYRQSTDRGLAGIFRLVSGEKTAGDQFLEEAAQFGRTAARFAAAASGYATATSVDELSNEISLFDWQLRKDRSTDRIWGNDRMIGMYTSECARKILRVMHEVVKSLTAKSASVLGSSHRPTSAKKVAND